MAELAILKQALNFSVAVYTAAQGCRLRNRYLRVRTGWALQNDVIPAALTAHIDAKTFDKTRRYNATKNKFGYVDDAVGVALQLCMLLLSPELWIMADNIAVDRLGVEGDSAYKQYFQAFVFLMLGSIVEWPVSLVLKVYRTFVIEEEFGFNKHTWKSFAGDEIKSLIVMQLLLGALMYMPMIFLLDWAGPNAWLYLWAFLSAFVLIFNIAYPVVIAPLFNTFTPLQDEPAKTSSDSPSGEQGEAEDADQNADGEKPKKKKDDSTRVTVPGLKKGIEDLIEQTGLACKAVFEVDGSKQSSHSNAYVAGMCGSKRIVRSPASVHLAEAQVQIILYTDESCFGAR